MTVEATKPINLAIAASANRMAFTAFPLKAFSATITVGASNAHGSDTETTTITVAAP